MASAYEYGVLISADGAAQDLRSVWLLGRELQSSGMAVAVATIGCIVEALVSNGDAQSAVQLVHDLQADE